MNERIIGVQYVTTYIYLTILPVGVILWSTWRGANLSVGLLVTVHLGADKVVGLVLLSFGGKASVGLGLVFAAGVAIVGQCHV